MTVMSECPLDSRNAHFVELSSETQPLFLLTQKQNDKATVGENLRGKITNTLLYPHIMCVTAF